MSKKAAVLTTVEPVVLNTEPDWMDDYLQDISDEARETANEIVKKIELAERHVANAHEAGNAVRRSHKIPVLPIHWKSVSKGRHLDATMKSLEAVNSLFEVQQTYIELINQSTKFGREVNFALATYVEQSYGSQMGSIKKLSTESEAAISSLVQNANTVLDIQERNSKQILFSSALSGASLIIAIVSLILVFTT